MIRHMAAAEMGLRVIIPDRPGMGYSDFKRLECFRSPGALSYEA
jgi:hypothetical protein